MMTSIKWRDFLNEGLHSLLQLIVSSILIAGVFFYLSPIVACFAILPIPIIIVGGFRFRGRLTNSYGAVRKKAAELGERLSGMITGVVTIRASVAEGEMVEQLEEASQSYINANQQAIKLSSAFVPVIRMGFWQDSSSPWCWRVSKLSMENWQRLLSPSLFS